MSRSGGPWCRHEEQTARVIPILLRPTDWQGLPFAKLQALPTNARPVTSWRNRDAAFLDVVLGIRAVIGEITSNSGSACVEVGVEGALRGHEETHEPDDKSILIELYIESDFKGELAEMISQKAIQKIQEVLSTVEIVGVRTGSVILTLRMTEDDGERLRELTRDGILKHTDLTVRANYDINSIVSNWEELLGDVDASSRRTAAKALGRIGPAARNAAPRLIDALWDEDSLVRRSAAEALGRIGPAARNAASGLIDALWDEDTLVRQSAAEALGRVGPEKVAKLTELLRDGDRPVRLFAAEALGRAGPAASAAVPQLAKMLGEARWYFADRKARLAAAEALGRIGPAASAAVPQLAKMLGEARWYFADRKTRLAAAEALGRIGPAASAAVPQLMVLLKKNGAETRLAAEAALSQILLGFRIPSAAWLEGKHKEEARRQAMLKAGLSFRYSSQSRDSMTLEEDLLKGQDKDDAKNSA